MIFQVFGQNDNKVKKKSVLYKLKLNSGLYIFIEAVSRPKICSPINKSKV